MPYQKYARDAGRAFTRRTCIRNADSAIHLDDGLEKLAVKALLVPRHFRVIFVKNEMEKELIPVEVDGSPSQVSPEHGNAFRLAIFEIYLLLRVLVKTNTNIGCGRRHQGEGLLIHFGQDLSTFDLHILRCYSANQEDSLLLPPASIKVLMN
jgi:hypothetical protein